MMTMMKGKMVIEMMMAKMMVMVMMMVMMMVLVTITEGRHVAAAGPSLRWPGGQLNDISVGPSDADYNDDHCHIHRNWHQKYYILPTGRLLTLVFIIIFIFIIFVIQSIINYFLRDTSVR